MNRFFCICAYLSLCRNKLARKASSSKKDHIGETLNALTCTTGIERTHLYYCRYYKDDGQNNWAAFSGDHSATLCAQYREKSPFVHLGRYTVDFRRMHQRNNVTAFERPVRCSMTGSATGLDPCVPLNSYHTTHPKAPLYGGGVGKNKTKSPAASSYCANQPPVAAAHPLPEATVAPVSRKVKE